MRTIESTPTTAPTTPVVCDASPAEIADAQRALNTLAGHARLAENGVLDAGTRAAVIAFQREHGLPPSGCLDERTQTELLEAAAEHATEAPARFDGSTARATTMLAGTPRATTSLAVSPRTTTMQAALEDQLRRLEDGATDSIRSLAERGRGGVSSYAQSARTFRNEAEATRAFDAQASRLFDVARWDDLSGWENADFALFDSTGAAMHREARVGDFVQIKLGPDPDMHWVRIESVSRYADTAQIVVRPSYDPTRRPLDTSRTDHFFTTAATNTFTVQRTGSTVTASVRGRNEHVNTADAPLESLANRVTAESAWGASVTRTRVGRVNLPGVQLGGQNHQWARFTESLSAIVR